MSKTKLVVEGNIFSMTKWSFWREKQQVIFLTWKKTCVTVFSIHFWWFHNRYYLILQFFLAYKLWLNIIPENLFSGKNWLSNIETPKQLSFQINLFRNKQKIAINSQGYHSGTCILEGWNKSDITTGAPETSVLCLCYFGYVMLFLFYWIFSKSSERLIRTNVSIHLYKIWWRS